MMETLQNKGQNSVIANNVFTCLKILQCHIIYQVPKYISFLISGKMSSIEKDFAKIIALAERSQDESAFQNHLQYKKFKARYQNQVVQSPTYFGNMYRVLRSKKFYNEHVFWGMKILENQRLGNKEDRAYTLYLIVNSFYNLNDYENVLKYGEKALEHEIQPNELTDTKAKRRFLEVMQARIILCLFKTAAGIMVISMRSTRVKQFL